MKLRFKIGENQYKTIDISELAEFRTNNPGATLAPMESDETDTQSDTSKIEDQFKYRVGDTIYKVDKRDNINFLQKHGISNAKLISSPKYQKTKIESKVNLKPYEGFELPTIDEMEEATKGWLGLRKEEGFTKFMNERLSGTGIRIAQRTQGKDAVELLLDDQMEGEGIPFDLEEQSLMGQTISMVGATRDLKDESFGVLNDEEYRKNAFIDILTAINYAGNPDQYEEDMEHLIKITSPNTSSKTNPNLVEVEATEQRNLTRNESWNNWQDMHNYGTTSVAEIIEEQKRRLQDFGITTEDLKLDKELQKQIPLASWQVSYKGGLNRWDWIGTAAGTLQDDDRGMGSIFKSRARQVGREVPGADEDYVSKRDTPISPGIFEDQKYTFSPRWGWSNSEYREKKKKIEEDETISNEEKEIKLMNLEASLSPVDNYSDWRLVENKWWNKRGAGSLGGGQLLGALGVDQYHFNNTGKITLPSGREVSLQYIYNIRKDIHARMKEEQEEAIKNNPRNFQNPVYGGSLIEELQNVFPEKYKAAENDMDFVHSIIKEQTNQYTQDGKKRKGSYYDKPLDRQLKNINVQKQLLSEGKAQISGHLFDILMATQQEDFLNDSQKDLKKLLEEEIIKELPSNFHAGYEGRVINISKDLETKILKELDARQKIIKNTKVDDELGQTVNVIPPEAFDLDGNYKGIEDTTPDPTMYIDNGDGTAIHKETGEVVFYGIEEEAQEMAEITDFEEARDELVHTYMQLVHSTKLNNDYFARGVDRETNALMKFMQRRSDWESLTDEQREQMRADFNQGLKSDIRQTQKFTETGWDIFNLSDGKFDQDVLTTIDGGSSRAREHNALLRKFKTMLRVVDLNQNIAQLPQETSWQKFKDDINHFVGGGYFNNEYTDDQAYEIFTGFLQETGHEIPDHEIDGWYGRTEKELTWSGAWNALTGDDMLQKRSLAEFSQETVVGLVPLLASLWAGNKLSGFKGLMALGRTRGAKGVDAVSKFLVGKEAPKTVKWITKNMLVPGVLTQYSWTTGELLGQGVFGSKHEEQWKAMTVDTATGDTRLTFPFVMGAAPAVTNRLLQGIGTKLLTSPVGPYYGAVSRTFGGQTLGQGVGLPLHGINASAMLSLAEGAQIITSEALAGNNPFKIDDSPHGRKLREEWAALTDPQKAIGTAIAMMVLHGKGVPGKTYKNFTEAVSRMEGWRNVATKESVGNMGLSKKQLNDKGYFNQSTVNKYYKNEKAKIKTDPKLTEQQKKQKLEQLEKDKKQVETFNDIVQYKSMYENWKDWQIHLNKQMVASGAMQRFMNQVESDSDLVKLSELSQREFMMMMSSMGMGPGAKNYSSMEAWWEVIANEAAVAKAGFVGTGPEYRYSKGGKKEKVSKIILDHIKKGLEITRLQAEKYALEESMKDEAPGSKSKDPFERAASGIVHGKNLRKAQIDILSEKIKALEESRIKRLKEFDANWKEILRRQMALNEVAVGKLGDPNLTMTYLGGEQLETIDEKGAKKYLESEWHRRLKEISKKAGFEHVYLANKGADAFIFEESTGKVDRYGNTIYKTEILINVDNVLKARTLGTGLHELTHYILRNSLKEIRTNKDGTKEKVLSKNGIKVIEDLLDQLSFEERQKVEKRINDFYRYEVEPVYNEKGEVVDVKPVFETKIIDGKEVKVLKEKPKEAYYEEYITAIGQGMKDGWITKRMSLGRKLAKKIYPILTNPNNFKGFKEKHGKMPFADFYKFDINQKNSAKAAKDLMNMLSEISSEGITREVIAAAKASGFEVTNAKHGEWKDGQLIKPSIQQSITNPKTVLEKVTHTPKGEIKYKGADGKPSHELFVESGGFKAGEKLMQHSSLDAMIRARMQGETAVLKGQEMTDFIEAVKIELLERYKGGPRRGVDGNIIIDSATGEPVMRKGYRYDENPSIFGWLTNYNKIESGVKSSIIYYAKGDVMKKWKELNRLQTISKDTPIGEKGTIEDLMYADSKATEAFENQDISISARGKAKRAKNEVEYSKLKEQIGLNINNAPVSGVVKEFLRDSNLNITGVIIESSIGGKTIQRQHYIPPTAEIIVKQGQAVKIGEPLTKASKTVEDFKNEAYDILTSKSTPDFRSKKLTAMLKDGSRTVKEGRVGEIKVVEDQIYAEFKELQKDLKEKIDKINKEYDPLIEKAFEKLEFEISDKYKARKKEAIKALEDYKRSLEHGLSYNMPIYDVKTGKLVFERTLASYEVKDLLFKEGDVVKKGETLVQDIKTYLEKAYGEAFRLRVQKMLGVEAVYDNFVKSDAMEAIWEKMTPEALQKLERLVPQELRKFTTRRRIKDKETVDKLIADDIFPKGTDYKTGPWLTEKAPVYPGAEVMSAFFRGVNMKKVLGYEVTTSQLGNRKNALALEIAEIMGLDMTMEVLRQPRTKEQREYIREVTEKEKLDNELAILDSKIKRSPSLKFSISKADAKFLGEEIIKHGAEEVFKKGKTGELLPELKESFIESTGVRNISKETIEEVLSWETIFKEVSPRFKMALLTDPNLSTGFKQMMLTQETLNKDNPVLLDIHKPYIKRAAEVMATYLIEAKMMSGSSLDVLGIVNRIYDPAAGKKYKSWDKLSSKQKAKVVEENPGLIEIDAKGEATGYLLENGKRIKGAYHDFFVEVQKAVKKQKKNEGHAENAKDIEIFNSSSGTMKKMRPIKNYYTGNGIKNLEGKDVWGAKEKHAYAESLYGKKINSAGAANLKAYEDIVFELIKEVEVNERTGGENSTKGIGYDTFYHIMQIQNSLVNGPRGLSRFDFIYFADNPQGGFRYKKKNGKWEYTFDKTKAINEWIKTNPKLTKEQAISKAINRDNPLLIEAIEHYKKKGTGGEKFLPATKTLPRRKNPKWRELTTVEAQAKALEKINKEYGEHMGAHQNTALDLTYLMYEITKGGKYGNKKVKEVEGEIRAEIRKILRDHTQFSANDFITDILDIPGSTHRGGLNRFNALNKYAPKGNHMNNIFTFTGKSVKEMMLERNLSKIQASITSKANNSRKKNNTYEGVWKTSLKTSTTGKKKGMSTFDFDDTLGRTKSGVRATVPNPSGLPKPKKKVIFLAGGAGSGKSNVVKKLNLEQQGFKIVNQDISLEWLKKNHGLPENMRELTKEQRSTLGKLSHQARGIAKRKMEKFQGRGDGIVVDGTGASKRNMEKLVTEFKDKGYDVSMLFVETSLETALARNAARKERSLLDIIVRKNHESVMANKDVYKELFGERFMDVKTDNLKLEDSMPKKLIDKMNNFVRGYEKIRLDAEQFALHGESILKKGGKFDFSEFNKVVEGTEGPYLKEALKKAKKYGTKDMFVLTARPQESARSIQEFLKGLGLDIPIENITGLGNSTANAKAKWMLEKYSEGYNDFYFVDDALANVDAVKKVLEQVDVKSKVVQAKIQFSKTMNSEFNEMIERKKNIEAGKEISAFEAKRKGRGIGKWDLYVPPSAEDFKGLMYKFIGEGKQGEADMRFMKEALFRPFAEGIRDLTVVKQKMSEEYKELKKQFKDVDLTKEIKGTSFTNDLAIRTYLWEKMGYEAPGMTMAEKTNLLNHVNSNPRLLAFAENLSAITRLKEGYIESGEYWMVDNIASDLNNITRGNMRERFLSQWIENKNILFSRENMNKIESVYGPGYREALENILHRMETGTNRLVGKNSHVNGFYDWMNGSVGAIMFWNTRSAMLQTISMVNFLDYGSNNILAASKAFANQPQFWADFKFIFNSPMLKQRRAGLQIDVSANELTNTFGGKKKNLTSYEGIKAIVQMLLRQGFTPTKIADSFAIAAGGAPYYRNRVNKYLKQGMSRVEAEKEAWLDFQEKAEETQQSSRPDLISQQQAGPLGRVILPFQNTPMQMTRLQKKGIMDLYHRRRNPGETQFQSDMSNISKVLYYGAVQNIWFYALQSGLMWAMFGNDQEQIDNKKVRVANGALDTILRGTGIYGAGASTVKNMVLEYFQQKEKPYGSQDYSKVGLKALDLSPPLGAKVRKVNNAIRTWEYNKGVSKHLPWYSVENPNLHAIANVIEATTNAPTARALNKTNNLEEAITGNHQLWERAALFTGWNRWDFGILDEELEEAKAKAKAERTEEKKKIKDQKKEDKKKKEEADKKKQGYKTVRCSGVRSNGERCSIMVETKGKSGKCYYHKKAKDGSDSDGDGKREYQCRAYTKSGYRCKNRTEDKSKKCWNHR